jgi:predicted metal-dependent enzyme (double-stranded beta helix superfamily)
MTLATLSPAALLDLVRSTAAHPERWQHHVQFTDDERYFHLLRSDELVDMWLLTWLPGQATTLHDHGGSAAAIAVAQGELHEEHADRDGGLEHHSLTGERPHWLAPDAVHDIYNSGGPPAISIHAYSPPLRSMTFYERVSGSLVAVRTVPTREPEA